MALQLKRATINLDTLNKHIITQAAERALVSEKDIQEDELRDLVTMKPLKEQKPKTVKTEENKTEEN